MFLTKQRITKVLNNKVIFYLVTRYVTYGLGFITSLIIAAKLGPYYMGIWGFIFLIINYFTQINFGIGNSMNVLLVHNKGNVLASNNYIINSLALITGISVIVLLLYLYYLLFGVTAFEKYNIDKYVIWIVLIAILQYYNSIFVNIFRIKNKINQIIVNQSIQTALQFLCVIFFKAEVLVGALVFSYVLANLINVLIALSSNIIPPLKQCSVKLQIQKEILKKGIYLFLYNTCFYFILISIRTIISHYYAIEQFGIFTFSFTLSHSIILILDALSFLIFPKMIHKLSSNNNEEVVKTVNDLRTYYISTANLLIYAAMICFPLLLQFFPKYQNGIVALNLIALTTIMNTFSFGYSSLLIAKNKEKQSSAISFSALIINILLALILVVIVKVTYEFVIIATMITYLYLSIMMIICGRKLIKTTGTLWQDEKNTLFKMGIPFLVAFIISVLQLEYLIFVPLIVYSILNYKDFRKIKEIVIRIIKTPQIVNL